MSSLSFAPVMMNPAGSACFTSTDPHYAETGAPARMADGRMVTDYRPRCYQYPIQAAQQFGDNDARLRMIHGADALMAAAREMNDLKNTPTACDDTMVPELYKRVCTWEGCKTIPGNFMGIGTGRIFVPSSAGNASSPQALSDEGVPQIPLTFPRHPPRLPSQCAVDDPETQWSIGGAVAQYGASAKSHPYSAPRA